MSKHGLLSLAILLQILLCSVPPGAGQEPPTRGGMHYPFGETPARPGQEPPSPLTPPTGGEIVCPGEFCRADGCFLTYETQWGSVQILMDIAYEVARDDTVYMLVKNSSDMNEARNLLIANGVNTDHVRFIYYYQLSENCIWVRDYGPVYIYEDGGKAIVDFWYPFTSDDDVPITVGAEFGLPVYTSDLLYSGGNFMTDGNGMGFATNIVYSYNTNYTQAQVRQIFRDYC
jgi:agmatine deiminase